MYSRVAVWDAGWGVWHDLGVVTLKEIDFSSKRQIHITGFQDKMNRGQFLLEKAASRCSGTLTFEHIASETVFTARPVKWCGTMFSYRLENLETEGLCVSPPEPPQETERRVSGSVRPRLVLGQDIITQWESSTGSAEQALRHLREFVWRERERISPSIPALPDEALRDLGNHLQQELSSTFTTVFSADRLRNRLDEIQNELHIRHTYAVSEEDSSLDLARIERLPLSSLESRISRVRDSIALMQRHLSEIQTIPDSLERVRELTDQLHHAQRVFTTLYRVFIERNRLCNTSPIGDPVGENLDTRVTDDMYQRRVRNIDQELDGIERQMREDPTQTYESAGRLTLLRNQLLLERDEICGVLCAVRYSTRIAFDPRAMMYHMIYRGYAHEVTAETLRRICERDEYCREHNRLTEIERIARRGGLPNDPG